MGKVIILIPSYFPDESRRREGRKKAHHEQLDFITTRLPWVKVVIVAQNYEDSDYYHHENVEYFKYDKGIGLCKARNVLFRYLYESDYDYAVFTDDDCIPGDFEEIPGVVEFLKELCEETQKYLFADVIVPALLSGRSINKELTYKIPHRDTLHKEYTFKKFWLQGMHWMLIKNLKKYYGEEYYHPIIDTAHGEGYEDMILCTDLMLQGKKMYTTNAYLVYQYYREALNSTIFSTGLERNDYHDMSIESMNNRYEGTGVVFYTTGNYDTKMEPEVSEFCNNRYRIYPDKVIISRTLSYKRRLF